MPMNTPPPWGKKKKPTDPEEFLADLIQKVRDFFEERSGKEPKEKEPVPEGGGESGGLAAGASKIALAIAALVLLRGVFACFYTIEPGEQGIVLRFGKYSRTAGPGLNLKIPYMEDMMRVDVETVRKEEFGLQKTASANSDQSESLMLTGDKNVINVAWIVQYKIKDPYQFLFKVSDVAQAVRDNSETVIRRIVGNMDFDYVLGNRITLADMGRQELQRDLNKLETGVDIVTLQLLDVTPTDEVKPAFNDVNAADQDMKRLINEAEQEYNKVIPEAKGTANKMIEEARGYAAQRINDAKGETARFKAIAAEYEKSKEVTRQRMYLETMQSVLPQVRQLYIMDGGAQPALPLLNLNSTAAPPPPSASPSLNNLPQQEAVTR
ncbi:FtsH protease activity modulator HflK [Candidatus Electronema sp. TJ]|uniref:FtsH protease activity modulator HflK n=1 Tax=Candidatus Electronema sp. TJ TaxID=3401573 RepID=UPI003AA8D209